MIAEENVFVIDKLENLSRYAALSANMKRACDFLATAQLDALAEGKNVVDGEKVFINKVVTDYVPRSQRPPEVHHRYFDIHIPLEADECLGLAPFDRSAAGSFDESKDLGFYQQAVQWFTVRKGEFALCWPKVCAHAPAVTTDIPKKARKLIVKVLV